MIISRHIFAAKEGKLEEVVEYAKWFEKRFSPHHPCRLYAPIKGACSNVLVEDQEFESREEWERLVAKVHSDPDFESAIHKYREIADIQHELWQVVEME